MGNDIISKFSKNLFWDVDTEKLDLEKNASQIVERVLECGRWEDWKFVRNHYGMNKIKEIALNLRGMYPKTLSFISLITHTPENKFRCYEQLHSKEKHWYF